MPSVGCFRMNLICDACADAVGPEYVDSPHTVLCRPNQETFICQGPCRTFRPYSAYVKDGLHREGEPEEILFEMVQTDHLTVTTSYREETFPEEGVI